MGLDWGSIVTVAVWLGVVPKPSCSNEMAFVFLPRVLPALCLKLGPEIWTNSQAGIAEGARTHAGSLLERSAERRPGQEAAREAEGPHAE